MFVSNDSYWLDTHHEPMHDDTKLKRVFKQPALSRMERDGWVRKETGRKTKMFYCYEKQLPKGWILRVKREYLSETYELE